MRAFYLTVVALAIQLSHDLPAQGWSARLEMNFQSGMALTSLDNVSVYFSGVTVYGSSPSATIVLHITGTGTPSGPVYINASGRSLLNPSETVSVTLSYDGPVTADCERYYLDHYGNLSQYLTGNLSVYPRLAFSFEEGCDQVTLTSDVCAPHYTWEVGESASGPFTVLSEFGGSVQKVTGGDLASRGLSRYGLKYFRVTGWPGTTSPVLPVYMHAPGPAAVFDLARPRCHDGDDGSISITLTSALPGVINDFLITATRPGEPEMQYLLTDSDAITISGLRPGMYHVRIENQSHTGTYGACASDYDVGLENPSPIELASIELSDYHGVAVSCEGASDGSIKVVASGGSGIFPLYQWSPSVSTAAIAEGLPAGTYSVKVMDSEGCWSASYSRTLTAPAPLQAALRSTGGAGGYDVSCHNTSDGAIQAALSGGVEPYRCAWADGATDTVRTGLATGRYSVIATDFNGCTADTTIILTSPPPIAFEVQQLTGIACAGQMTASLTVASLQNTIGRPAYSWSTGDSTRDLTGKGAGAYSVTVSDEQGCRETRTATVIEPLPYSVKIAVQSDYQGQAIRCAGSFDGALTADVRDGMGQVASADHYTWHLDGLPLSTADNGPELSGVGRGMYQVTVTYNGVCETRDTLRLDDPPPVVPVIVPLSDYHGFPVSCSGATDGSISVRGTGGTGEAYSYHWSTGETQDTLVDIGAGIYQVAVTDENGCTVSAGKVLHAPDEVSAAITAVSDFNGQALSCSGAADGHLTALAQGGASLFTYEWNSGDTTQNVTDLPAGTYTVTVTDANGCRDQASMTLMGPPPLELAFAERSDYNHYGISCNGDADGFLRVAASGGTGAFACSWNDGEHSAWLYQHLAAGEYSVVVTDENGCAAAAHTTLTEPPPLYAAISRRKDVSCFGGTDAEILLAATGGVGGYAYARADSAWQPDPLITGLEAGVHRLMITDMNKCVTTVEELVKAPPALAVTFSDIRPALCGNPQGEVTAVPGGGTGEYTFSWKDAHGKVISTDRAVTGLAAGIYTLALSDAHACVAQESVGITATDGPEIASERIIHPSCFDSHDGRARISVAAGDGPFSAFWEDGQTGIEATALSAGSHVVVVKDVNGCAATESITLVAPDPIDIDLIAHREPRCSGSCDGVLEVLARGGNGSFRYAWHDREGPRMTDLCAGDYLVTVSDIRGCTASQAFALSEPDPLTIALLASRDPSCPDGCDGALEIAASGGTGDVHFAWSTNDTLPRLAALCPGVYTAMITDSRDCQAAETFALEAPQARTIDLGGNVTICAGQSYELDAGPNWQRLSWTSDNGFTGSSRQVTIVEAGTYSVEAISPLGCVARDTFELRTSNALLNANFLLASAADVNDTIVAIDISWPLPGHTLWILPEEMMRLSNEDGVVYGKFNTAGEYALTLSATLGQCRDEMTKRIAITDNSSLGDSGRLGYTSALKAFSLYPNPNDGNFYVSITLETAAPVRLTAWNTLTGTYAGRITAEGRDRYVLQMDLRPLSAGAYMLRLDYPDGHHFLRFVVH